MKLFNTLGRKVDELKPIKPGEVTLYTCGPTVYDYAHIGNLRTFIFEDTMRRALEANGLKVKHVMNITDVGHLVSDADDGEDKLEKGAKREGKDVWAVAESFTEAFKQDVETLNILPPTIEYAKATDYIQDQIDMITILVDKGYGYQTKDAVYFDVSKLPDYGKLTGQKLSDKEIGARSNVVTDKDKRNPQDFALWFFTVGRFKDHVMHWQSPWGDGFPGWHIECSAIIKHHLGDTIDIHTGGVDHIGTHHTNEIAQSEAANNKALANIWVHGEHMMVEGKKMSKSLGNFYTLNDITGKGFHPLSFRLLVLQAHYRKQLNFTWQSLEAAQNFLQDLYKFADLCLQSSYNSNKILIEDVQNALANDLDTPKALAILSTASDKAIESGKGVSKDTLTQLDSMLGLDLANRKDVSNEVTALIKKRQSARESNNYDLSDTIRDELKNQGIALNDTANGTFWYRSI